jgi:hypothetical protein
MAGAPLAHAAGAAGIRHTRLHPNPSGDPWSERGGLSPNQIVYHHRVTPDPINYPNRAGRLGMQPAACPGGCSRVLSDSIGATKARMQPDPCPGAGCKVGGPTHRTVMALHHAGGPAVPLGARRDPAPALNPQPLPPHGDD